MSPRYVLFDLNGTLTDPAGLGDPWGAPEIGREVLGLAVQCAMVDTVLGRFRPFTEHVESALRAVADERGLDPARVGAALERAAALSPFPDTPGALAAIAGAGLRLAVLTNSGAEAGRRTLRAAGLEAHFDRVLGVDAVRRFKPHPDTYAHALRELGSDPGEVTFVSAHAWDLAGGAHAGMRPALVRRGEPAPGVLAAPELNARDLNELAERLVDSPQLQPAAQGQGI